MIVKAAVHIHSDWSYDGNWSLSRIVNFFGFFGYDLILTAEHDRTFDSDRWHSYRTACMEASTKKTLVVPGMEYSDKENIVHILVWGVSEFLGSNQKTGCLLKAANENDGICVLAHPGRRNAWQFIEKSWIPLLNGIELWNRKFDGIAPSHVAIDLLRTHCKMTPFTGLDFHQANQIFPLSMRIDIDGTLSDEKVFHALRKLQCRSLAFGISSILFSSGFLFSFTRVANVIKLAISSILRL